MSRWRIYRFCPESALRERGRCKNGGDGLPDLFRYCAHCLLVVLGELLNVAKDARVNLVDDRV